MGEGSNDQGFPGSQRGRGCRRRHARYSMWVSRRKTGGKSPPTPTYCNILAQKGLVAPALAAHDERLRRLLPCLRRCILLVDLHLHPTEFRSDRDKLGGGGSGAQSGLSVSLASHLLNSAQRDASGWVPFETTESSEAIPGRLHQGRA